MSWIARLYYRLQRWFKAVRLYLVLAGPGVVVMIADNDAGGITTYAATGAKYEYHLIWFLVILGPVAYYVQEMTVRLGRGHQARPRRGHLRRLRRVLGLVLAARPAARRLADPGHRIHRHDRGAGIFGVPAWLTVVGVCMLMGVDGAVNGRYWTWEKIAWSFCVAQPDLHPRRLHGASAGLATFSRHGLIPEFPPAASTASCSSS